VKLAIVTLGCDKNTVDSERYLADLVGRGAEHTDDLADADVIVVNTCGFIDAAKQDSIGALVEAAELKAKGSCRAVVAVGCMVERHKEELLAELPEVDLFLGTSEIAGLVPALESRGLLESTDVIRHPGVRLYMGTAPHIRYLKVSEGCDHGCAFCAIPLMRGRHRSFDVAALVAEAQLLESQGARELNLVAQDLALFGRDRRDGVALPDLLEHLVAETSIPWLRLLYLYSAGITPHLMALMAAESRIVPYIDMPIQHGSDAVLARMRRPERASTIRERVARLRDVIPDVAVRTTCIVGFPGETDEDFERLEDLLEEVRFERVGVFAYSAQEGTRAAQLADDVPDVVKRERLERLTERQRGITAERYERHVGRTVEAIVDRAREDGSMEARVPWQADDIDGITRLEGTATPGSLVRCVIDDVVDDYDFEARELCLVRAAPESGRAPVARSLPVLDASSASYGR